MKNVVLLGGSNSLLKEGLERGLKGRNINLTNLSLGGTGSLQAIYEIKRDRNKNIIQNADLIIIDKSLNDTGNHTIKNEFLSINIIARNVKWLFEELSLLNKKILVLILPRFDCSKEQSRNIANIHIFYANKYKFNVIDVLKYYETNKLSIFGGGDAAHPMQMMMRMLGRNIIKHINNFHSSHNNIKATNPKFKICSPSNMQISQGKFDVLNLKNSRFNEVIYQLKGDTKLCFPPEYKNYLLIGIHTWHNVSPDKNFRLFGAKMVIKNKTNMIVHINYAMNALHIVQNQDFYIDDDTNITLKNSLIPPPTEYSWAPFIDNKDYQGLDFLNIVDFLLAEYNEKYEIDTTTLANTKINDKYNFECYIPPILFYKKVIEKYFSGNIYTRNIYTKLICLKILRDLIKIPSNIFDYIKKSLHKI